MKLCCWWLVSKNFATAATTKMSIDALDAIQSLADLQSKFQPENLFSDSELLARACSASAQSGASDSAASGSSVDFSPFDTGETLNAKVIDYRGEKVAGFELDGKDMICLPQVYDLFLKTMVGGLHTVYTKLKRLEIQPVICNVEQVRALRGLGAIQPGVNRCKLIATTDFDQLYDDCTNTCTRPGRPPKRSSTYVTDWAEAKREVPQTQEQRNNFGEDVFNMSSQCSLNNPLLLGQFLPQFNAHQILMQHIMSMTQSTTPQVNSEFRQTPDVEAEVGLPAELVSANQPGWPLNLTKSLSNVDTSETDSSENARIAESSLSPSQYKSKSGRSSLGSFSNNSPPSDQSTAAVTKIINLIDLANEQFKHQKEILEKDRQEVEFLRSKLRSSLLDEEKLRDHLNVERKRANTYFRRYCKVRRDFLDLKEEVQQLKGAHLTRDAVNIANSAIPPESS